MIILVTYEDFYHIEGEQLEGKIKVGTAQCKYLGYIVQGGQVKPDPEKIKGLYCPSYQKAN